MWVALPWVAFAALTLLVGLVPALVDPAGALELIVTAGEWIV
jgi:hypothetical protein